MRKNTRSANAREGYQDPEEIEKAQLMMQQMMAGLFQAAQNESSRSGSPCAAQRPRLKKQEFAEKLAKQKSFSPHLSKLQITTNYALKTSNTTIDE